MVFLPVRLSRLRLRQISQPARRAVNAKLFNVARK
jgi:hypothetical protein